MNNGVVNRHENECSGGSPFTTGTLIEDPEVLLRFSGT
jgi:hypothetical protein